MRKESFSIHERIRKKKDFDRIHQAQNGPCGTRLYSRNFTVLLYRTGTGETGSGESGMTSGVTPLQAGAGRRLGVTVGKKVGNAVIRNRFKRLLREFFRRNKDKLPPARDILIIVRKNASVQSYQDVCTELGAILFRTANN